MYRNSTLIARYVSQLLGLSDLNCINGLHKSLFIFLKTSLIVILAVQRTFNILLYILFLNNSNFFVIVSIRIQDSTPYTYTENTLHLICLIFVLKENYWFLKITLILLNVFATLYFLSIVPSFIYSSTQATLLLYFFYRVLIDIKVMNVALLGSMPSFTVKSHIDHLF